MNLPGMLSSSRQIATQHLDGLLASAKQMCRGTSLQDSACLDQTDTLTQNITTTESEFPESETSRILSFALLPSQCIQNDAVQVQTKCRRLWIPLSRRQNPLLRLVVTINVKINKTKDGLLLYVGDAGNTSLLDAGTPLGATAVVTPGSAGYLLWECCILASL